MTCSTLWLVIYAVTFCVPQEGGNGASVAASMTASMEEGKGTKHSKMGGQTGPRVWDNLLHTEGTG